MTTTTTAEPRTGPLRMNLQPGVGLLVIAAAGLVSLWAARADSQFAVFWLMGMAFGFVLQRSRFCFTSAFRDLFLLRDGRVMKGVIAGMAVATVGFGASKVATGMRATRLAEAERIRALNNPPDPPGG